MLFGWLLAGWGLWWQVMLAPLLPVSAWWVGPWIADRARHSWRFVWLCGMVFVGTMGAAGYVTHMASSLLGGASVLRPAGTLLVGLPVLRGCFYALRQSWFSRNIAALLPIAALPLAWILPWMGRLAQGVYLTSWLGVPLSAVSVDPLGTYLAGVKPAAWCIAAALCGLSALGWARHFYWITGSKAYCILIASTLTVLAMTAALMVSLSSATAAADRTAAQAASGRELSPFFGIHALRVCVRPLDGAKAAVQPGPLPTDHPVIVFGGTGDETWLWDPQRSQGKASLAKAAMHVRSDQIATRPAARGTHTCPPL
ncbi:hypothetical protein ABZ341_35320 [Streptomyces sp. NPDC006173]|uniref:hypothetical protein n=1 Tax=Streptomyces sp. NPDC006173 TaxID=3155349 RepID=UPI0033F146FB